MDIRRPAALSLQRRDVTARFRGAGYTPRALKGVRCRYEYAPRNAMMSMIDLPLRKDHAHDGEIRERRCRATMRRV